MEAIEMYQELCKEGLCPEEAAKLVHELMGETCSQPAEPWQIVLGLAMVFLCVVLTIGGL